MIFFYFLSDEKQNEINSSVFSVHIGFCSFTVHNKLKFISMKILENSKCNQE